MTTPPSPPAPHPTWMRAEIHEQPEALERTLQALAPLRAEIAALAAPTSLILLIGRGSSDNAATYGRYLLETQAQRLAALAAPSVATLYDAQLDMRNVLAVAVSQSGDTEEIVETLAWARTCGARTMSITNRGESTLAATADLALVTQAGVERAVPATKTYTTQLAALATVAAALSNDPALDAGLRAAPAAVAGMLDRANSAGDAAALLTDTERLVVTGRGIVYGTALELALKLEEACYVACLGLSHADLQHGPLALLDDRTPLLVVAADSGPAASGARHLAQRARAHGCTVIGIGAHPTLAELCTHAIRGPELPESLAPLGLIVPGQLIVEQLARARGINPDAPRNLNKVTQTVA